MRFSIDKAVSMVYNKGTKALYLNLTLWASVILQGLNL